MASTRAKMAVDPAAQGLGIGRVLIEAAELTETRERGRGGQRGVVGVAQAEVAESGAAAEVRELETRVAEATGELELLEAPKRREREALGRRDEGAHRRVVADPQRAEAAERGQRSE